MEENKISGCAPDAAPQEDADFIERDCAEFARRFPRVDLAALDEDAAFRRFCGSRYGRESIADLYEDYLAVVRHVRDAARAMAESKKNRATGSGGSSTDGSLTAAEQRSLEEWNRANPAMKMTAKEFAER